MFKLFISVLFINLITFHIQAQDTNTEISEASVFDIKVFLDKCGGRIYPQCNSEDMNQLTVYKAAEAVAIATGKSIFLIVGAEWCPPCHLVDRALNSNPEIRAEIEEKFVIVSISGDQNATSSTKDFLKYLNIVVRGFPTFFRVDPVQNKASQLVVVGYEIEKFKAALFNADSRGALESMASQITELSRVPVEMLDVPVDLEEKFGQYTYITSGLFGRETLADKAINAGIARIHNFHYIDAVRAFRMAVKEEPNNDLARSFLALAYIKFDPRYGDVFANLELMKVRRGRMNSEDAVWYDFIKSYVFTSARNLTGETDVLTLSEALANLYEERPNDLEVLTLAQYLAMGTSNASPFYAALKIDPNHLGANHYLIHYYEESSAYPMALDHAEIMAAIATDSSHAQHMLGHVLPRSQEWQKAKDQFNIAAELHNSWAEKYNFELSYDWHYSHNLDLMAIAYVSFGQVNEAIDMFKSSCLAGDSRGCESLLKLAAAEGRLDDIKWVKKYYSDFGADIEGINQFTLVYEVEAKLNFILGSGTPSSVDLRDEALANALAYAKLPEDQISDTQAFVVQYMLYVYLMNQQITDENRAEFEDYESKVIDGIFDYSENRVGCSSFDGWGKGLLDTYRFYRLSETLEQHKLSERLKSILLGTLGIPFDLK